MPTYSVPATQTQGEDPIIEAAKNFMQSPGYARQFMGNLQEAQMAMPSNQPGHIGGPSSPPPPRPFTSIEGMTDRDLLAGALAAEGAGLEDMQYVANVIANRVRSDAFPGDYRSVILQPGQFSAFNGVTGYAGGEGANTHWMRPPGQAYELADTLLGGGLPDQTRGALNYYNPDLANPEWGGEGFYRLPGSRHVFGTAGR